MNIHARVVGMEQLRQKLKSAQEGVADMKPFWRDVGNYMTVKTIQNFKGQHSPDDKKWQKWSEAYKRHMKKIKRDKNKILSDVGTLRSSIKYVAFKDRVFIGSNVPYARRHQLGDVGWSQGSTRGMPARPYLGVTDRNKNDVKRMLYMYVKRKLASR